MSKVKKVISFPFKVLALAFGCAMMLNVFLFSVISGCSIDKFCEKVDLIMDKLDEIKDN